MKVDVTQKENGTVVLSIEVSVEETRPYLDAAGQRLAHKHQIPGFRPGKAPLSVIRSKFGDEKIYEELVQELVPKMLVQALREQKIDSVGQPEIRVEKLAPENPIVFSATVAQMPDVRLDGWRSVVVKKNDVVITESDIDSMVNELREMQAKEILVDRAAKQGDKVEVNFEVKREGALIEGGKGIKYPLIIGKGAMIPGFEEQIIGMQKGEKKNFELTFPKPYMDEKLAGKKADFEVEVLAVYERELPIADDTWAKNMLGKTYAEVRAVLRDNLRTEKQSKEDRRIEHDLMKKIVEQGSFSTIPNVLLENEVKKMVAELQDDIQARGMKWDQYLQSIRKTVEDLEKEFQTYAAERVKSALAIRALSEELQMTVSDPEIDHDLSEQRQQYQDNEQALEQLARPEYRSYLKRMILNRKTIDNLVSLLVK